MKVFKNWDNKDWMWTTSILIGIIVITLTWRLNDNDSVVNIISMFSSGASIILALVAIVQSTIYNNSSNELNSKMTEKLTNLQSNIEVVKENIIRNANEIIENAPISEEAKEEIKTDLVNNIVNNEYPNYDSIRYIEEKIYKRIINIYSKEYKIIASINDGSGHDVMLENNSKRILIQMKVLRKTSNAIIEKTIKSFNYFIQNIRNEGDKNVIPVSIIVIDDITENYKRNIFKIYKEEKIVLLSKNELLSITDEELKLKINI